jgi:hypothetical protein
VALRYNDPGAQLLGKKQNQVGIRNRVAALENFIYDVGIDRAWKIIGENMNISAPKRVWVITN